MKRIMKELEAITRQGYDFHRVFNDWLTLMVSAFCQYEAIYQETIQRYPSDGTYGERPADCFAKAMAALLQANQEKPHDYLGDIFTEHVTQGQNGQFFTPDAVCELMAEIAAPTPKDNESVCDPACGSGRMLLSVVRRNRLATFYGVDIDQRCAQMTALNLLFRNVNGAVVWGNALTLECWGGYMLHRSFAGGNISRLPADDAACQMILKGAQQQGDKPGEPINGGQLTLF